MFVHDVNQFVTVQLFEETPAVLLLGKLCENHGYSYESICGQKPRLTKNGKSTNCKTDNVVPLVVPGLSANSGGSSSSTSLSQESLRKEADQASGNRAASSSSSGSVFERSAGIPEKSKPKHRGMTRRMRTIRWQIFLAG